MFPEPPSRAHRCTAASTFGDDDSRGSVHDEILIELRIDCSGSSGSSCADACVGTELMIAKASSRATARRSLMSRSMSNCDSMLDVFSKSW